MNGKELSAALKQGKRVYGTLVASPSPKWAQEIHKVGIDFVFIDTEHIPIDRTELSWMCRIYRAMNIAPVVRISAPDPYQACMALDAGACGMMAPYIETVEQVKALRGAVKLRPLKGKRLQDILEGKAQLSIEEEAYLEKFNEDNLLFLNIESRQGIDTLDRMLEVPGVDGVIIGPHDLSISLGVPEQYSHPLFDEAVLTIIREARNKGIAVGNHYSYSVDQEIRWASEGMNIILHSADISGFINCIGSELNTIREALGDITGKKQGNIDI